MAEMKIILMKYLQVVNDTKNEDLWDRWFLRKGCVVSHGKAEFPKNGENTYRLYKKLFHSDFLI